VVGGGVTVVGVAVGVFLQVHVGGAGEVGGSVDEAEAGGGAGEPVGVVSASAECETNSTVRLVTASAVLANPAIFVRFVIFKAVTPPGLRQKIGRADGEGPGRMLLVSPRCDALVPSFGGTPGRNAIERQA
jgi:hypothetical protein